MLFRLSDDERERRAQALSRMAAGPEVPRDRTHGHLKVFSGLSLGPRHVAVLALLPTETRLREVVAPFEERLRLLADDACAQCVAVRTDDRRSHARISHCLMGSGRLVRTTNLAVGREMAAGARQANGLLRLRSRVRLGDVNLVDVRKLECLRKMTDVTGSSCLFSLARVDRKRLRSR